MKRILIPVVLCIPFTGCATLNENFDCPVPEGGSCKRMDQIYAEVNENPSASVVLSNNPENIRIWIAPYQDSEGNFHEATHMHAPVHRVK